MELPGLRPVGHPMPYLFSRKYSCFRDRPSRRAACTLLPVHALGTGALLMLLLAIRIVNEEHVLTVDLFGYEEYRRRVRYRLVPFIW